eukprot:1157584-Pelagomonas_calceolata.AAC.8
MVKDAPILSKVQERWDRAYIPGVLRGALHTPFILVRQVPRYTCMWKGKAKGLLMTCSKTGVSVSISRLPNSTTQATTLAYDVIGHPRCNFRFAVVLPFHTASKDTDAQVTMIREFCQGPNAVCYNLPTGGFDPAKHTSIEDCARAELSEEVRVEGP